MAEGVAPEATGFLAVVYTTIGSEADAKALADRLLEARLIACANLVPIRSLYTWKGAMQDEPEIAMFLKTDPDRVQELLALMPQWHPYEVPCVEVLPVTAAHPPFASWVHEETRPDAP